MRHQATVGLGFGDEGKGMVVDHLASRLPGLLNVRFSGGHQVGHTVVSKEKGVRHVFSNFGSATLRGKVTYWSKGCTVCPVGLTKEASVLRGKGVEPGILINAECPVVTPMDRDANRSSERKRANGSCGVGFGATLQREEDFYSLRFVDLFYPEVLRERLRNIAGYYGRSLDEVEGMDGFMESCEEVVKAWWARMVEGEQDLSGGCIFEGSQGMLLDQNRGFFPNVTRSNTGSDNVPVPADEVEWFLVTRAYQTRHGKGFMTNEDKPHNIEANPEETNVTNEWQGEFRRSLLDVSLLQYAMRRDERIRNAKCRNLVVTCMDHVENEHRFVYKGEVVTCSSAEKFVAGVSALLGIDSAYASFSADGENWRHLVGAGAAGTEWE